MREEFERNGFITHSFPQDLRKKMLDYIDAYLRDLGLKEESTLENVVKKVPDAIWQQRISRSFRIFPQCLSKPIFEWAHHSFSVPFGKQRSAVNVVFPQEAAENPKITTDDLAIYWRCVRPGKPDAGRPHRDASFWDLEFKEGYDPKVPFAFNYLENCMKIWIPLYGCTSHTSLRVIPGSHQMDIPTIVENTEYGRRPSICPDWLKEQQGSFISPPELAQGACILFDMNLVHVGPRHNHTSLRISAEFNFITANG